MTAQAHPGPSVTLAGLELAAHDRWCAHVCKALGVRPEYLPEHERAALEAISEAGRAQREAAYRDARHEAQSASGWLSVKEAAGLAGITARGMQLRAQRGQVAYRRVGRRLEIDPVSLCERSEQTG